MWGRREQKKLYSAQLRGKQILQNENSDRKNSHKSEIKYITLHTYGEKYFYCSHVRKEYLLAWTESSTLSQKSNGPPLNTVKQFPVEFYFKDICIN